MSETGGPFGGLTPSEAGRKSWEKRRQRAAEAEAAESSPESNGVLVVTTTDIDSIIGALRDKAKKGDVPAARELRDWIEVRKEDDGLRRDKRLLDLLSPGQRACIAAALREQEIFPDDALAAWCGDA
jgi:hypothetical protein